MKTDHVQLKDIFARINALRIQEGYRPYASKKYVAKMLKKHGCKVMFVHFSCDLYNIKSAIGIARKMMNRTPHLYESPRNTRTRPEVYQLRILRDV